MYYFRIDLHRLHFYEMVILDINICPSLPLEPAAGDTKNTDSLPCKDSLFGKNSCFLFHIYVFVYNVGGTVLVRSLEWSTEWSAAE